MSMVISWNVNSVKARLQHLITVLRKHSPDVVLLQEIKCETDKFPYLELEDLGYNIIASGQKSYNGVAILSKAPLEDVFTSLSENDNFADEARYIEAFTTINGINTRIASVYAPQGTEVNSARFDFKLRFYEYLNARYQQIHANDELIIAGGDYNVAPEEIDVYDPKHLEGKLGFHIEERKSFRAIINGAGVSDSFRMVHPHKQEFSWWDYRSNGWRYNRGMRIDQVLISSPLLSHLDDAGVISETRSWERASDHAPIFCTLKHRTNSNK
jgi:exodeoxyribonuclease III